MQAQCLCGAVHVTAPTTTDVHVCHCSMCRRWSEGPAFTVHGGTEVEVSGPVTRYASSDWAERAFCSRCGTHFPGCAPQPLRTTSQASRCASQSTTPCAAWRPLAKHAVSR